MVVISGIVLGLKQISDHTLLLHPQSLQISSEMSNQPLAVDTFIKDFAVEVQNIATSLANLLAVVAGFHVLKNFSSLSS